MWLQNIFGEICDNGLTDSVCELEVFVIRWEVYKAWCCPLQPPLCSEVCVNVPPFGWIDP